MNGRDKAVEPFGYCLNTSTIRGQELGLLEELGVAAEAGYDAVEPWVRELDAYIQQGGTLKEVRRRAEGLDLTIENLVGFFDWVVDDSEQRHAGLEEARRNMHMASEVGCTKLAAPPSGATDVEGMDLLAAAERYADLLRIGEEYGVIPVVEFWGVSKTLGRLGEAVLVAVQSGHEDACVLADVFHMYKGGSPYEGLRLLGPRTLGLVHVNDFPADPSRSRITDAGRVYPGDGVAPLPRILGYLREIGFRGTLSLELFNQSYWEQDALTVARTGLEKMRRLVGEATETGG
ncbi:MAG: sugar phosphate isomerase/epimerase family protein [Candidatus Brocadiaceae bacterium]|jgi:sugar phosphate isomerase/epimerase